MNLTAGTRVGHYEILAPIGEGGMGEVYRAHDTILKRDVALKVLPLAFANDPERMSRFQREAEVLASLNHPNIAAIYGVEQDGSIRALAMEFVEGESPKGPLPFDDAWKIASQIAEALSYAHDKGVIHRDLKPANVKVTPDGVVKLLDFGLAKAFEPSRDGSGAVLSPENSPTLTMGATEIGMILGTAAYMAPEQAKGRNVDKRADIWAFGVVLHELLIGEKPFKGDDVGEILASIIKDQPNLENVPAEARPLIESCLEKDPKKRLRDIGDAQRLLESPMRQLGAGPTPATARFRTLGWILAVVFALATAGVWLRPKPSSTSSTQQIAFMVTALPGTELPPVGGQSSAPLLSPDGASLLSGWHLRRFDSPQMERVDSLISMASEPFWSADSKWVAFSNGVSLFKTRVPDGSPEAIAPVSPILRGGAWAPDGTILIGTINSGLRMLGPGTATFAQLAVPGLKDDISAYHPEFLPGRDEFLFMSRDRGSNEGEIFLAALRGEKVGKPVLLMKNDTAAHYTPAGGGRLLFVRGDNLYSQKLDLEKPGLSGDPDLIQKGVASAPAYGVAYFSVSASGTIAWRPGIKDSAQVVAVDRTGRPVSGTGPSAELTLLRLAPDESHLLGSELGTSRLMEVGKPGAIGLGKVLWCVWSPDGTRLIGVRGSQIVERSVVGDGDVRVLVDVPNILFVEDITPDGKTALYSTDKRAIFSVALDTKGVGKPVRSIDNEETAFNPRFSPDGRWVVYDTRGVNNKLNGIFVQPFPGPGLRKQISASGFYPIWRADGREIIFADLVKGENQIWSLAMSGSGENLQFGTPKMLFSGRPAQSVFGQNPIAVSRDGSRIYFPQAIEQPQESRVIQVRTAAVGN